ncbi:high affinity choline transporter 1-like [Lethenteron reissneri]|uniref:high affinity choline transporter 1-like n=1 Tax=Lethenteron reissneri TaxID=7753 RepID=UPI002AB630C1|nr:high affinity choline transporter 1-like [Lethenteron reissneri]XP_061430989.1 high affinity choline transporter 1-like [Lethenteron reissneri]XP_061430990.1 high affinity choline transporter 1-like [Lethenteron reissneri]XP_061430991.1 high affinity choline transporter 1-like [Lethenteron reissneri]XP_061430992.1 high affinity choline transporter 1-like [Lethenteron reissneri]XP_061430993.1 high affinity choline transporter 1-like [Lethenteron reissneri]
MATNVGGLVAVIVFYIAILATGVWASRKSRKTEKRSKSMRSEMAMVGDRKMNVIVGIFTTTATWVGGAYINGTAEVIYTPGMGLAWMQAPIGSAVSLFVAALFFAKPMRSRTYITMIDPFQIKYGKWMGSIFFIPAVFGDLFWAAATLTALGSTISVILDIDRMIAVMISAFVAIFYTLLGGLYSVAYTDIIQLGFIAIGLVVCVPFSMMNQAVTNIGNTFTQPLYQEPWVGTLNPRDVTRWLDNMVYMILGGIPWQVYFQRVLAAGSVAQAQYISFVSAFTTLLLAMPPLLIGAVAVSTDWNMTTYGLPTPHERGENGMILPIVLQHICPYFISILGMGALAAAVMSSADSALLSASSLFTRNIYAKLIRPKASDRETLWVLRISILAIGSMAMILAIKTVSTYSLWLLCGDMAYVIVFPQFCLVLFFQASNSYGLVVGFVLGLFVRLTGGEALLGLPALFHYPGYYEEGGLDYQMFPMKTLSMMVSLLSNIGVCYLTRHLFLSKKLPARFDFFNEFGGRGKDPADGTAPSRVPRGTVELAVISDEAVDLKHENGREGKPVDALPQSQ